MKITGEEWVKYFPGIRADVIGDGKLVDKVYFIDTERGIVDRYVTDAAGNCQMNADKTEALTERLQFENVELRIHPR